MTAQSSNIRELFVEELAEVHAGSSSKDPCCTTMACCEEGPFGCCDLPIGFDDLS